MAVQVFPLTPWDDGTASFTLIETETETYDPFAVVVVALQSGKLILADIPGRGWCTPSGRIEPGETPLEAAHRELYEEAGGTTDEMVPLGYFRFTSANGTFRDALLLTCCVGKCDPIPAGSESRGICVVSLSEMQAIYYRWNPLLEIVFQYAADHWTQELPQQ